MKWHSDQNISLDQVKLVHVSQPRTQALRSEARTSLEPSSQNSSEVRASERRAWVRDCRFHRFPTCLGTLVMASQGWNKISWSVILEFGSYTSMPWINSRSSEITFINTSLARTTVRVLQNSWSSYLKINSAFQEKLLSFSFVQWGVWGFYHCKAIYRRSSQTRSPPWKGTILVG
jgi:hypothetical protein